MKVTLLKWSRLLHKWLGIYITFLTLLWLAEIIILPFLYNEEPIAPTASMQTTARLSIHQLKDAIDSGAYGTPEHLEFRYQPKTQHYLIVDKKNFTVLTMEAETGKILQKERDYNALFVEKTGLGWINLTLASFLKILFQIFFIILAVTGLYILLFPTLKKKKHL